MKVRVWLIAISLIGAGGCKSTEPVADSTFDNGIKQSEWQLEYTTKANNFTSRTYQCMTEMYSLAYDPVNSGPICKEACRLLNEVNTMVATAPAYVVNPQQYHLKGGDGGICKIESPHKHRRADR